MNSFEEHNLSRLAFWVVVPPLLVLAGQWAGCDEEQQGRKGGCCYSLCVDESFELFLAWEYSAGQCQDHAEAFCGGEATQVVNNEWLPAAADAGQQWQACLDDAPQWYLDAVETTWEEED
jgi:hypothetical protein